RRQREVHELIAHRKPSPAGVGRQRFGPRLRFRTTTTRNPVMKSLRALTLALAAAGCLTLAHAQSVRPEVGKPLQAASELLRAGKAKEALGKIREADAVGGKTAAEQL